MLFNDLALIYWTFYGVIAVAITPNLIGAAVISGAFYGLSNLFAGICPYLNIMKTCVEPLLWSLAGYMLLAGKQIYRLS